MESKLQQARIVFTVKNSVLLIWDNLLYVKDYMTPHFPWKKKKSPQGKKQSLKPNSLEPQNPTLLSEVSEGSKNLQNENKFQVKPRFTTWG